jgi:hypothetical protein
MPKTMTKAAKASKAVKASAVRFRADELLAQPTDYNAQLAKLGQRDRTNLERHLEAVSESQAHAKAWRRLVAVLGTLAPVPMQTIGQHAILFFIPDGKYKMQAFALEDIRDGKLLIYVPDTLALAAEEQIISIPKGEPEGEVDYPIGSGAQTLRIEALDAGNTPNPPAHVKNLLGWNRRALKIVLNAEATPEQLKTAELFAALGVMKITPSGAKSTVAAK